MNILERSLPPGYWIDGHDMCANCILSNGEEWTGPSRDDFALAYRDAWRHWVRVSLESVLWTMDGEEPQAVYKNHISVTKCKDCWIVETYRLRVGIFHDVEEAMVRFAMIVRGFYGPIPDENPLRKIKDYFPDLPYKRTLEFVVGSREEAVEYINNMLDRTIKWLNDVRPKNFTPADGEIMPVREWLYDWTLLSSAEYVVISAGVKDVLDIQVSSVQEALDIVNQRIDKEIERVENLRVS